jgi:lipopolysaccharide export system permease protein
MIGGTLQRYIGLRFLNAVIAVLLGAMVLVAMIDFLEMLRRTSIIKDGSTLLVAKITAFRLLFVTERIIPFAVLVGAMACFLNLSRRLELVIARSAGISAWQFVAPALIGAWLIGLVATTLYNPASAILRERSVRLEDQVFKSVGNFQTVPGGNFWARQRSDEGQAIISAKTSRRQGIELGGVSIFRYDEAGHFRDRIEAKSAVLEPGYWRLEAVRIYSSEAPPAEFDTYGLKTTLTTAQVGESFATPETVPFWELSSYIQLAENAGLAASAYRLQYYQLLVQPFYYASMVLLAAAVSLRFFRFGGVQKMVLGGLTGGFFLYVLAKVTGDLSKAGVVPPLLAAALPALLGGVTGVMTLLYQEDG